MRGRPRELVLGLYRTQLSRDLLDEAVAVGVTALDTATSYHSDGRHAQLGKVLALDGSRFDVHTKIGFGWDEPRQRWRHSLEPKVIREQLERLVDELRQRPASVLLHNPELAVRDVPAEAATEILQEAVNVLTAARTERLIAAWGIASWDPELLIAPLRQLGENVQPDRLMVRCGVGLRSPKDATVGEFLRLFPQASMCGAQPLGGSSALEVIDTVDVRSVLLGTGATNVQALLRFAFEHPGVKAVAVSTSRPGHLRELSGAVRLEVDVERVRALRALLGAA